MTVIARSKRDMITPDQLDTIEHHFGWEDGREGYLWTRFDSNVLGDDPRKLRAEITWDDEYANETDDEPIAYFAPVLTLESNRRRSDGSLETHDQIEIPIDFATAVRILAADPVALLHEYAAEFAGLIA